MTFQLSLYIPVRRFPLQKVCNEHSTIMPILGLLTLQSAQKLANICNTYIY